MSALKMPVVLYKANTKSSRSHMLIGISLCKPQDGPQAASKLKAATLWVGDLCGAEALEDLDMCTHMPARARARHANAAPSNTLSSCATPVCSISGMTPLLHRDQSWSID